MAEVPTEPVDFSDLPVPAQLDLPEDLAEGLIVPLMSLEVFAAMHETIHGQNYLFSVGHIAVELTAHEVVVDSENEHALLTGCQIY